MKIDEVLNPGRKFIKSTYGSALGWNKNKDARFILNRGIVLKVDIGINNDKISSIIPPGSIQAKIIGEDISGVNPKTELNKWYTPLMSLHNIAIPEVGEEVWIIRESTTTESQGSWICRVSESSSISRVLSNENLEGQSPIDRYGFQFEVNDIKENITQDKEKVYTIPFRQGDVIQQGRTNTYIRQSFDPLNNSSGVLEAGIKESREYTHNDTPSVGKTRTKTIHVSGSDLRRLTNIEIEDGSIENDVDIIYSEADVVVNVSKKADSETTIQRHILGNKQTEWLKKLIATMQDLAERIEAGDISDRLNKLSEETSELLSKHQYVN